MRRRRWLAAAAALVAFAAGFATARQIFAESEAREAASSPDMRRQVPESRAARPATTRSRQVGPGAPVVSGGALRGEDAVAFFDRLGGPEDPDCDEACRGRIDWSLDVALRKLHQELFARKGAASQCSADGLIDDTIVNIRYRVSVSPTALRIGEGTSIDEDLPADVRRCLDDYLRDSVTVTATELGGPLPTAEFDTLDIFPTGDLREPKLD